MLLGITVAIAVFAAVGFGGWALVHRFLDRPADRYGSTYHGPGYGED